MSIPLHPDYLARGLPCVVWHPARQGARTSCTTRERVCGVHGSGGSVAPAPCPGSRPQTHPHTPRFSHWYAAGTGRKSIGRFFFARDSPSGGATASARLSSLCGLLVWCDRRASFARSATVSVAVQNKGGYFFQPMSNVRGGATIGSSLAPLGKIRPSLGASSGRTPIG